MRTADDVIKRVSHDANVDKRRVKVSYIDRFAGLIEKPFESFDFGFADADPQSTNAIPQHRIQSFRYDDEIVWDKSSRLDAVFGSSGTAETILDVVKRHPVSPPRPFSTPVPRNDPRARSTMAKRDERGDCLLKRLGYSRKDPPQAVEKPFDVEGLTIDDERPDGWTIRVDHDVWRVETKVVFEREDIDKISNLVARLAPPGSTARLQADAHGAGNVYVGIVVQFDDRSIPVSLVSADIGCGISIIPVLTKRTSLDRDSLEDLEYRTFALGCMRRALKRGKIAEHGTTECAYVESAASFYDDIELGEWLDEMAYVLSMTGILPVGGEEDDTRVSTLRFVSKFAQTLGSSGNHFMELATDDFDDDWLVVHSGSRGLGAMVHSVVSYACKATSGGFEVATGPLAIFYRRAYDALNGFAKLNRIACAVAVLEEMGEVTDPSVLLSEMRSRRLFSSALARVDDNGIVSALMSGLTHNGIKAFVNHDDKKILFLACKGAIAVSKRGAAAIVALRAGEGCVVFLLADATCPWVEMPIADAVKLQDASGYFAVGDADGVVLAGHGAGRTQSASKTSRMSTFEEIKEYFDGVGVVANIAPGVLGDNPKVAYKPSDEILNNLPLGEAAGWSFLRTRVSHKEGISFKIDEVRRCARYIESVDIDATPLASIWHDIAVCRRVLTKEVADERTSAAEAEFEKLRAKFI